MKIVRNYNDITTYEQLDFGDVFTFNNRVYMRINHEIDMVDLENGEVSYLRPEEIVIPHKKVTLTLE